MLGSSEERPVCRGNGSKGPNRRGIYLGQVALFHVKQCAETRHPHGEAPRKIQKRRAAVRRREDFHWNFAFRRSSAAPAATASTRAATAGHLLIDAGVSCARVVAELRRIGIEPGQLSGLLVTHEHIDHIRGVGVLSRRFDLPIYATEGTMGGHGGKARRRGGEERARDRADAGLFPRRMSVMAFDIPHDAAQPVGYSLSLGAARLCVATDIGCVRDSWLNVASGADAVVLESNYDPDMLRAGPYPYALKQRILSRRGHLANDDAGRAAVSLVRDGARQIVLATSARKTTSRRWRRSAARWRWRARACASARTPPSAWPSATASPACSPCAPGSDGRPVVSRETKPDTPARGGVYICRDPSDKACARGRGRELRASRRV